VPWTGRHLDALGQARRNVRQRIEAVIDWYRASNNPARGLRCSTWWKVAPRRNAQRRRAGRATIRPPVLSAATMRISEAGAMDGCVRVRRTG
jgi:hypothetical protein